MSPHGGKALPRIGGEGARMGVSLWTRQREEQGAGVWQPGNKVPQCTGPSSLPVSQQREGILPRIMSLEQQVLSGTYFQGQPHHMLTKTGKLASDLGSEQMGTYYM